MVGYSGNFPAPLAEHHKCPCCSYALRDPLQTECGHRICKECYADLQRQSGRTGQIICPVDGSIVLPHQVFPDMYAKREVLNLATYCMYRNSGCQWHGVLKDYEDHIIRCEYEDIRCPNGCNQRLPKHLIEQHLLQSCPRRLVECEYCKAKIPSEELEDHYEKCELFPVDCLYNCGTIKIPRKLLQQHHENECPNAVGACSYSFAGCNFKGTKDEVLDHLAKETTEHLRFAAIISNKLRITSTELSRKFENESNRAGILEQMVSGQAEDLEAITFQYKELRDAINSLERNMDELKRSGQITRENLNQIQRRAGPAVAMEMDRLREQARLLEQKVDKALQKGSNVQVTQMTLSGASSLPVASATSDSQTDKRIEQLENQLALQDVQIAELNLKLQLMEATEKRRQDAIMGKSPSLYSPPFYTSRFGYMMCARLNLNGDGKGKGTHISLFFVVMKGEYDAWLEWPFPCKITLKLLAHDGNAHIAEGFCPVPNSSSFRRPSSEMNVAPGLSSSAKEANERSLHKNRLHLFSASATSDTQTDKRIEKLENQLALQDLQIAELNLKLQLMEATSYDGKMIWKIDNFEKRRQDAIMGKSPFLYSPPFYTSRFGYKMCAKIYLNGDNKGKGTHVSLFFVVMKGEYDAWLEWPFPCKFILKLLAHDGNAHIAVGFCPVPNSSSFRRPSTEMNIASGLSSFVSLQKLMKGPYIKNDCIFVQVIVDTSILANSLHSQ